MNVKRQESLREKLKIDFAPKLVAANPSLQPIYDVILSMLKSTEFWEDLEKAIDDSIAEIEQKVVTYVLTVNAKSAADLPSAKALEQPSSRAQATPTRPEPIRTSTLKADTDSRSVYSNIDKRLAEVKKKLTLNYPKHKDPVRPAPTVTQRTKAHVTGPSTTHTLPSNQVTGHPNAPQRPKKDQACEAKIDAQNTSMQSSMSWASDLLRSDEFLAKMAYFMNQQLQGSETNLYGRQPVGAVLDYQQSIPIEDMFRKTRGGDTGSKPKRPRRQVSDNSSEQSGLKEDQFNDVSQDMMADKAAEKRAQSIPLLEMIPSAGQAGANEVVHSNRYSRRGKRETTQEEGSNSLPSTPDNMFKAPISEDDRPVSVSDNQSNESVASEAHEKRLEMMKKNIVRRESLSKSAGLAFSFGKVPARMLPLVENLSCGQQVSSFE